MNRILSFASILAFTSAATAAEGPNILLVLSDDRSVPHGGCFGNIAAAVRKELKAAMQEWMILQRDFLPLPPGR